MSKSSNGMHLFLVAAVTSISGACASTSGDIAAPTSTVQAVSSSQSDERQFSSNIPVVIVTSSITASAATVAALRFRNRRAPLSH